MTTEANGERGTTMRKRKHEAGSVTQCLGKIRYVTCTFADAEAKRLATKYGHPMRAYSCGMCGGYHLTRKVQAA